MEQFSLDLHRVSSFHRLTGYHTVEAVHILITIVGVHYLPRKSMHFEFPAKSPPEALGLLLGSSCSSCVFTRDCVTSFGIILNS